MRVVQKGDQARRRTSSIRTLGIRNILFLGIFLVFGAAVIVQFANPNILNDLRQRAAFTNGAFLETFDGAPSTPELFSQTGQDEFDVQIHSRDIDTYYKLEDMDAHHGMNCESPEDDGSVTHHIDGTYESSVFHCANHVMTAINAGGYGVIYLTPNAMVDFTNGEATIKFDVSTLRTSDRDWIDLWVTPYDQNVAAPYEDIGNDLQGNAMNAVHIRMDNGSNPLGVIFRINVIRNGKSQQLGYWETYNQLYTQSAKTRQKYELKLTKTSISFGMPAYNTYKTVTMPALDWSQGVVQFGHHSYNPFKCNDGFGCGNKANTWHWDNIEISPAIPFTMVKANKRFADPQNPTINLQRPAPANAFLRFVGIGIIDVSYDGGPFQRATKAQSTGLASSVYAPEHMSSYWTPIPQGTQQVKFRFSKDGWYEHGYIAKDFAVWTRSSVGGSDPVPSPTTAQLTQAPSPTTAATPVPTSTTETPNSVLSLLPSTKNVNQGETFTVDLSLNTNGQSINAVDSSLVFPSDKLRLNSISINSAFEVEVEKTIGTGTARVTVASTTPKSGTVRVATLSFTALQSTGTAGVTFSSAEVISSTSNSNVLRSTSGGSYSILAPTPTPTRTPTPTPTRTPTPTPTRVPTPTPAPTKKGDLNADGKVDIQDLSIFLTYWENKDQRGDLNNDRKIDVKDVSILVSGWTG